MAHNLNYNEKTNKYAFASVKQKAWHGLGQVLDNPMDSETAIREAQLDWNVIKEPVKYGKGNRIMSDRFVTTREDNEAPLGIVGNVYEIIQNVDAFKFFDAIVGKGEAIYETAGALYDGRKIFITAKLPDYIHVSKNDLIEKYLFLTTTHDGSGSILAAFTPVRVVCHNTLNLALNGLQKGTPSPVVKIRHTAGAAEKLEKAHRIMGISNQLTGEMESIFKAMTKKRIVEKDFVDLVVLSLGSPEYLNKWHKGKVSTRFENSVKEVLEYSKTHHTQLTKETEGTVYGALNAITGYFQNVKKFKNDNEKLANILTGTAQSKSQKAFDLCYSLLK